MSTRQLFWNVKYVKRILEGRQTNEITVLPLPFKTMYGPLRLLNAEDSVRFQGSPYGIFSR